MKPIRLTDSNEDIYLADVVRFSVKKDLVLLSVPGFTGPSLEIWNPQWDGEPPIGMELIAMGYPAYYATEFSWEQGFLKDIATVKGIEMLVSEESSYSGESGGPVVSTANGKVMGIVEAGVEQIAWLAMLDHSHVSISLFISANEINSFLR
jgi:S1-C subfamily serine protease